MPLVAVHWRLHTLPLFVAPSSGQAWKLEFIRLAVLRAGVAACQAGAIGGQVPELELLADSSISIRPCTQ